MKKERTILELLNLMKECFNIYFDSCLCRYIFILKEYGLITKKEHKLLSYLIDKNPSRVSWFYKTFFTNEKTGEYYYWYIGRKKPRLRWINKMIKQHTL